MPLGLSPLARGNPIKWLNIGTFNRAYPNLRGDPSLPQGRTDRNEVYPRSRGGTGAAAGGGEIGFTVDSNAAVDSTYEDWKKRGVSILQSPIDMDFGRTFVALDPDGHRLRVFAPAPA